MVEILLSTYNGARFLEDFLESLLSQTYKNWVLTVRDDGSKDKTKEILRKYAERFPEKINLVEDELGNLGACRSFLTLLMHAKAEYIMFADQDDVWLPNKVEKTLDKMLALEREYGSHFPILVHTDLIVVDENLNPIANSFWKFQGQNPNCKSLNCFLVQNNVTGCTIMINKALRALFFRMPERAIMHDWWIALVASAFGIVDYLPEATILYRQHPSQDTGAKEYSLSGFYKRFRENPSWFLNSVRKTVEQAREFLSIYSGMLSPNQKRMVEFYANLGNLSRTERLKGVIKWKLFKQGFLRNMGFVVSLLFCCREG